jgi:hypothetical protein
VSTGRRSPDVSRVAPPLFPNAVLAEQFEAVAHNGPYRVLPRTDGRFALVDERRPVGQRTLQTYPTTREALVALGRVRP